MEALGYLVAGFVVSVLCTPAGVSGAFLLLPIQVHLFGAPSPKVSATNLLYNVVSAPAGATGYWRAGRLDGRLARRLLLGTVPGVLAGVGIRSTALAAEGRFAVVSGAVLAAIGARLLLEAAGWHSQRPEAVDRVVATGRLFVIGLVGGVIGGVYGIGGAAIIVPWLVQFERLPISRVAGAGLVVTMVTSVVGLAAFILASRLGLGEASPPNWAAGVLLGIGGAAGAVVGVRIQPYVPVRALKVLLSVAAISAGIRMVI